MLRLFRKALGTSRPEPESRAATVGENKRVYAIGDIHGRADLLLELLRRIGDDDAASTPCPTELIFLGDLVDRGPASRQVVELALQLSHSAGVRFLKGNHEEIFIRAARGEVAATRFFCRIGGRETLLSYGLYDADYAAMSADQLTDWMLANIPRTHVDFLDGFADMAQIGDYVFVHAGIRPGVALNAQDPLDLRWIRNEFLQSREQFAKVVVHGHTITPAVDEQANRIGIDTGAYMSGRLTAIGLQDDQRWFLSTAD